MTRPIATATLLLVLAGACSTLPSGGRVSSTVFGTIDFPGDITPPAETVVLISLVEVPSDSILAQDRILNVREDPLAFSLTYDPHGIKDGSTYGVSVAAYVAGRLRWSNNPADALAITHERGQEVKVVLSRAD